MSLHPDQRNRRRRLAVRATAAAVAAVALALVSLPGFSTATAAKAKPQTVISLTFDDANANQKVAESILDAKGMKGTFFVPSGYVGAPGYLTRADLQTLKAHGHEIGGHTLSHPDLTSLSTDEARRQVCDDRVALLDQGFAVRSFAYPFADLNASVKQIVADCGYNSGRALGDLKGVSGDCRGCDTSEKIPPPDPYETKALEQVETSWTLKNLEDAVTRGEKKGGWVQFTFHNICTSGCEISVTPAVFQKFIDWLAPRAASKNTIVKTVGDTVGGPVRPGVPGPDSTPVPPGVNGVVNPGMESLDADGTPSCWMKGGYGSNTASLTVTSPGRTGNRAGKVTMASYVDGDAKWLPRFDLGGCAPAVTPGHTYSLREWYTSSTVTQFAVYLRDDQGVWHYWTSSPWFAAVGAYTQAVWETPAIPAGMTGISFGLNIFGNGSLETDDAAVYDSVGAPAAQQAVQAPAERAPAVSSQVEPQTPGGIDPAGEGG